jgi:hypothetical protein
MEHQTVYFNTGFTCLIEAEKFALGLLFFPFDV